MKHRDDPQGGGPIRNGATTPNGDPAIPSGDHPGWQVGQSIAAELDIALSAAGGRFAAYPLQEVLGVDLGTLAGDWLAEWSRFLGKPGRFVSLLGSIGFWAGAFFTGDYTRATLAMRDLTVAGALERLRHQSRALGIEPRPGLDPARQLTDLIARATMATYTAYGLTVSDQEEYVQRAAPDLERLPRILRDGDLHAPFWHWLDRFYFEFYRPWRERRAGMMAELESRALEALGSLEATDRPPPTGWLPRHNPLLSYPELLSAVQEGRLRVFFWVEPFGLSDAWFLEPGWVGFAFAEPGPLLERWQTLTEDLAGRAKALADPTRLQILRLIRHFGMDNTEMARYLGLARPTVSVHAKILREAGLIDSRQEGRGVRHTLKPPALRRLFRDLTAFLDIPEDEE